MFANINDGRSDAMSIQSHKQDRPANVQLLPVAVGRWPFLFVVACENIEPGGLSWLGICKIVLKHCDGSGFWHVDDTFPAPLTKQSFVLCGNAYGCS